MKAKLAKLFGESKTGYIAYYESDRLRRDLLFIIERFYDLARSANIQPVVVFVPRKAGDLTSARPIIEELRARFGKSEMTIVDVGRKDMDWNAFNLKAGHCHPSPYGYKMIAKSIMENLAF